LGLRNFAITASGAAQLASPHPHPGHVHDLRGALVKVTRFSEVVVRIRAAGEPPPEPLPGVVDIIGPAELAGERVRITPVR
jgi:hypothetical protein